MIRLLTVGQLNPTALAALSAARPDCEVIVVTDTRPPPIERLKIEMVMTAPTPVFLPPPPREWWRGKRPR